MVQREAMVAQTRAVAMGLGRIGVGLSGLCSFILLWAGLKLGAGDIVVPPKTQAHSSEGDPAGMAIPGWTVILGQELLDESPGLRGPLPTFPPILPGLGSGWKGCRAHMVPPRTEPLVFPSGSLGMTRPPCDPPQQH